MPPPQDSASAGANNATLPNPGFEDHSTVDGRSKSKNQDMAKWARQTGVARSSTAGSEGEAKKDGSSTVGPLNPIAFHSLKSISLSHNKVSDWGSIDALNKLPGLETLRIQHTPLNDSGGSTSILRQTFIARVSSLTSLNGGEVRNTERSDAEKL